MINLPAAMPPPHRDFLLQAVPRLEAEASLVGVALGGSGLAGQMDEFSDLDLVVVTEDSAHAAWMEGRQALAARLGKLLVAFTGEHVGEPRLLICLYAGPLHVDLKFVAESDLAPRVEQPRILWQRGERLTQAYARDGARFPAPDPQWMEDRFWVWVHYCAAKIGRGELFEAIDCLDFIRVQVLGPLLLQAAGRRPTGVRKIERYRPDAVPALAATVARHDAADCLRALEATVAQYRALREGNPPARRQAAAEQAACDYVAMIGARLRA
ncbi:hypothetical protein [Niveibacterium sp. SC-1]|uniref:hypothetical protein n=1 Tax=Niveibacterium sp. SC-1 TaxID=3135646 RepID=UPI00311DC85A